MMPAERIAVNPQEAANLLGIGRTTLYELVKQGRLRPIKVGRRTIIPVAQLEALLSPEDERPNLPL